MRAVGEQIYLKNGKFSSQISKYTGDDQDWAQLCIEVADFFELWLLVLPKKFHFTSYAKKGTTRTDKLRKISNL